MSCRNSLKHSGVAGGGARALVRISTLFAVIKKRVLSRSLDQRMPKNAYFWNKNVKITLASEPPFASGGWELRPRPPRYYSLLTIASLSRPFLALIASYYPKKRTK